MDDLTSRKIPFPDHDSLTGRLRSTVTGRLVSREDYKDEYTLMEKVLDMILLQPVNFDYVTAAINSEYATSSAALVNIGPGSALWRCVARSCPDVPFSLVDWSAAAKKEPSNPSPLNLPAAKDTASCKEPIAIVGMAVKFPQADNASELWDILEKGLNTVSEVCTDRQHQTFRAHLISHFSHRRFLSPGSTSLSTPRPRTARNAR